MTKNWTRGLAFFWSAVVLFAVASAMIAGTRSASPTPSGTTGGVQPDCAGDTTGGT